MIGLLLWKLPEKRGRSLRVGERSILHMRFTCAEITRGPKTPEAVLRRRVSAAGKRLRKLGITRAVLPEDFVYQELLERQGIRAVSTVTLRRALAADWARAVMETGALSPGNAKVAVAGSQLTGELVRTVTELSLRNRYVLLDLPYGGEELCRQLRTIPGLQELCLTTNGALLPQLAAPLWEAGLDRLNISLDTLRPDRFAEMTRLGHLSDALAGIEAAEAAGFHTLKLDTVLIGGFNDDEIDDFINLTREHPWEVRFIELMPMGPCAGWDRSRFLPAETVLDRMAELEPIEAQGVARRYQLPGALGTVGLISPVSHDFCADCRRIRVTADGKLKGCLHSREEIPLRGLHGQALEDAVRRGILHKPERHHLTERSSDTPRNMNQIGG